MSSTHIEADRDTPLTDTTALDRRRKKKSLIPLFAAIYLPTLIAIGTVVVVNLKTGIPLRYFFIDPVTEFDAPMYLGCISNLGVLLWCSCASVCLFCGWLLSCDPQRRETSLFLVCSGLITALLMFDDLFLLHEEVLPDHFFIPQKLVFVGYGTVVMAYFIRFRRTILRTEYGLLGLAMGFFAMSVFVDLFVTPEEFYIAEGFLGRHLTEDGLKLLGIVSWASYFVRISWHKVHPCFQPA